MRRELSKSGLGMFLRPLVMILCYFLCLSKIAKKEGGVLKKKTSQIVIFEGFDGSRMPKIYFYVKHWVEE